MNRAGVGFAATLVTTSLVILVLDVAWAGQGAQAPPMKSVLQGKKFMAGELMKPATNALAGRLSMSRGGATC